MKKLMYSIALFALTLAGCSAANNPPNRQSVILQEKKQDVKLLIPWENEKVTIQCMVEEIDSSGYKLRNLVFYKDSIRNENILYARRFQDYALTLMPLKVNSGNLCTIWESGTEFNIRVFSFHNGNISQVLEDKSKTFPELFYEKKESENLSILVTNMDFVKNKKTKERDIQPVSATLYRWDGSKYLSFPNIPWAKRFSATK